MKLLEPDLYRRTEKEKLIVRNHLLESVKHLRDRLSYHDNRMVRIQRRQDDMNTELKLKNDELKLKHKLAQTGMSGTRQSAFAKK